MIQDHKVEAHRYTIELRFSGDGLQPQEISACLRLSPSNCSDRWKRQPNSRARRPFWAFNGQGEIGFQPEWGSLEDGLNFLLKTLRSRRDIINNIAGQFEGVWWCGHFQASFDGGPTLSSKMMRELGRYEIRLSIDNYFSDD